MTAGLPGAGIGGLFYLASALLMPARSLLLTLRGRGAEARWGLALRQSSLAAGVVGALWATGELLGLLLSPAARQSLASGIGQTAVGAGPRNVIGTHALAFGALTLVGVLLVVQLARVLVRVPAAARRPPRAPDRIDRSAA